jgi:tRNA (guanine37-N1)-methyltransferase
MFQGPFSASIVKRAQKTNRVEINIHDLRRWAKDKHHTVDDRPYGGGPGMVMMVEPIDKALHDLRSDLKDGRSRIILTSAKGTPYTQEKAAELSHKDHLIIIAGHYEGVDERVADYLIDEEISIGPYVLTGGELPAMVIIDSVIRLLPGVVGDNQSIVDESHKQPGYLEYPHYTRPEIYKGWNVPEVLLSGHHNQIKKWRTSNSSNNPNS